MPNNLVIDASDLIDIDAAIRGMGGPFLNRLLGPALLAAARVVRRVSKGRGYEFTDRTGRLRRTIRAVGSPAYYGGRRYQRGRARLAAGGRGARQAFLVERGHGGPFPARPYPFLFRALIETRSEQAEAFASSARSRFPLLAQRFAGRAGGGLSSATRAVARRGRRR